MSRRFQLQQVNLIFWLNVTLLSVIILHVMVSSVDSSNFFQNVALQNVLILYVRASSIKESKFNFLVKCHSGKRHYAVSHGTYKLQQVNLIFSSNVTLLSVIILHVMMSSVAASNFFQNVTLQNVLILYVMMSTIKESIFKFFFNVTLESVIML